MTFGSIRRLFSDHPASVGETYLQHGRHALRRPLRGLRPSPTKKPLRQCPVWQQTSMPTYAHVKSPSWALRMR